MRDYLRRLRAQQGWLEPTLVSTAVLALTGLAFFRVALLPEFGRELSMSTFELGIVTTVFAAGRLLADLPGGALADRVSAGRLIATAAVGVALGSALIAVSTVTLSLYLASLLLGVCSSTTNATGMTYFSTVGGTRDRGTSMALYSAALLGGQAVGPAVAGLIASQAGWRAAMFTAAGLAAVVAIVLASKAGTPPAEARHRVSRPPPGDRAPVGLGQSLILRSVGFVSFLTLGSVPQTLIPVIGADELSLGSASIGLALGVGGVSRFVGTLIGGRLSDHVSRKAALIPGLVVQGIGVGLLAFRPTVWLWLGAIVTMSLASFGVSVAATMVGDLAEGGRVGSQLGRFRFAGDLGLISGPLVVSALYESVGREAAFLFVAGLLTLVALVSGRFLPETARRRPSGE